MQNQGSRIEQDRELLRQAQSQGKLTALKTYFRLSGPGWLQSALTLGGGSLANSLYLGVVGGFSLLWLQPMAILLGIVMLAAISWVTLSTGERPFHAMKNHISPVLAWGWVAATFLANLIFSMPQYSLATGVLQQNLMPGLLGEGAAMGDTVSKLIITISVLILTSIITFSYGSSGWGVRVYEWTLKIMVMLIVASFIGVVIRLLFVQGSVDFSLLLSGLIPDIRYFWQPAKDYMPLLNSISDPMVQQFWHDHIVRTQTDVMIAAVANAVGINMTFLMPYSLLYRNWDIHFRGLSLFDLLTGMMIPFVLATSCIIIASGSQFHLKPAEGLLNESGQIVDNPDHPKWGLLQGLLSNREEVVSIEEHPLNPEESRLAATLVTRDAGDLANALAPLTGQTVANVIFGFGVLAMTLSSITLLMVISGMVVCEVFNLPRGGWWFRLGSMAAAIGILGPFVWSGAKFYLAVPTSVFNYILLPLAYVSFWILLNSKRVMGEHVPTGWAKIRWNLLMGLATILTMIGAFWKASGNGGWIGGALFIIVAVVIAADIYRVQQREKRESAPPPSE